MDESLTLTSRFVDRLEDTGLLAQWLALQRLTVKPPSEIALLQPFQVPVMLGLSIITMVALAVVHKVRRAMFLVSILFLFSYSFALALIALLLLLLLLFSSRFRPKHDVEEPPPRLGTAVFGLGLLITVAALAFRSLLETATLQLSPTNARILYDFAMILEGDVGPGVLALGAALLFTSRRSKGRSYLYLVVSGVLTMSLAFTILLRFETLLVGNWSLSTSLLLYALLYSVGPVLIASGVFTGIQAEGRRRRLGLPKSETPNEMFLVAIIAGSLFLPFISSTAPNWRLITYVIVTWLVWHLLASKVAARALLGFRKSGVSKTLVRYDILPDKEQVPEKPTFVGILSKSYIPTAFGVGITFTIYNLLKLTPLRPSLGPGPFGEVADITTYSMIAMALGSLYVGPVAWILHDSGLMLYDKLKKDPPKAPTVHSSVRGLTEIYGFILSILSFVVSSTHQDYALALSLLTLMIYTIFAVALASTLLYYALSAKSQLKRFLSTLQERHITVSLQPSSSEGTD
jgi:hypothetical protein